MPDELTYEKELQLLVKILQDAYDALQKVEGVDDNGPALVWMADHLWKVHNRIEQPA